MIMMQAAKLACRVTFLVAWFADHGVKSVFELEDLQLDQVEALMVVVMEFCDLGSLRKALKRLVKLINQGHGSSSSNEGNYHGKV